MFAYKEIVYRVEPGLTLIPLPNMIGLLTPILDQVLVSVILQEMIPVLMAKQ
jgi:hypothetical protein